MSTSTRAAGAPPLDAEALYRELVTGIKQMASANTCFVGVTSGGAWLVDRLQQEMELEGRAGKISSSMHRDDFAQRGLSSGGQTVLSFDVNGADILILDDVLYTGRTIRAVINELFDYGRPASVKLAVLVDRGGRQLPVQADFAATRIAMAPNQSLALARSEAGVFSFDVKEV